MGDTPRGTGTYVGITTGWGAFAQSPADAGESPRASSGARHARHTSVSQRLGVDVAGDLSAADELPGSELRWSWVQIDLSAIRHNVVQVRRFLEPRCRLMAVVGADAYGHGALEVSKAVLGVGADRLAVATVAEAVALREGGIGAPILLLSQPPASSIPALLAHRVTPAVYEADFAIAYGEMADLNGLAAPYHLAVNTGMNRIGVRFDQAAEFLHQVSFHRALQLEGVFTQFATADRPETLDMQIQARRFADVVDGLRQAGFDPGLVHAATTASVFRYPEVHFDMVRVGAALYGFHPHAETREQVGLRPAMGVHARISDTRLVAMSEGVSFGLQYRSPGSVKICTVPLGYADGLSRILSGQVDFILAGRRFRQVGEICMDQCMFEADLRSYGTRERIDPKVGDEVVVMGAQGAAEIPIEELADKLGVLPQEVSIGFGRRLPHVYR